MASASTVAVVVPSPAMSEVLAGDFLHHLGAHVLVGIFELDLLGDGDAVLGDGRRAEFLVEDDVAALGAEGDLDGAGEFLDAAQDLLARGFVEHFSTSSLESPEEPWMVIFWSLPVPRSLAVTWRMPLASMSKVTSICGRRAAPAGCRRGGRCRASCCRETSGARPAAHLISTDGWLSL
jgi:hypothetical protein